MSLISGFLQLTILVGSCCDPYGINRGNKKEHFVNIIKYAEQKKQDPYELLAIAITESSLKPNAYSRTKDVGLFQVNCRWWYKKFGYSTIKKCEASLKDPHLNMKKGVYILNHFRNTYKQCQGNNAYRCYNGGQGWYRSKNKDKIIRYEKKVRERKSILKKYYGETIEQLRERYKNRS
jgi:soluble lytic murein transglycosylase-like protein